MKYLARGMARVSAATLVVSVLAVGVPGSAHATGTFLKIGAIKGESTNKTHKEEIEILSWSWGASQMGGMGAHAGGGGGGVGKVEQSWKAEKGAKAAPAPGEAGITLKRRAPVVAKSGVAPVRLVPASRDAGSLTTMVPAGMCRAGARYETVELSTGEQVYRMKDVLVTACAPGAASQDDRPMESISFNYTKIEY